MSNEYFERYGYPPFYEDERMYAMPELIDYTAREDHDLLVMLVMQGNDTVAQQEKMIGQLMEMNGTVKNDHAWVCAYRYAFYVIFVTLIIIISGNRMGFW